MDGSLVIVLHSGIPKREGLRLVYSLLDNCSYLPMLVGISCLIDAIVWNLKHLL